MSRIISLTSDFGSVDHYVGAMKGVMLDIAPDATLVDISHEVPPQNIVAGALLLEASAKCFPKGTVHLAVVDPGVGGDRAALAVEAERCFYVGPDNGLLALALAVDPMRLAVKLTNPRYQRHPVSATFHGRDIFAPAAAYLAAGAPLRDLGEPLEAFRGIDLPAPREDAVGLELHIIHVDRFGNLVTDLTQAGLAAWQDRNRGQLALMAAGFEISGISNTYADAAPGDAVAYLGSGGRLELAIRDASAADAMGLGVGGTIRLRLRSRA